jgi:Uma2 family endonuclease
MTRPRSCSAHWRTGRACSGAVPLNIGHSTNYRVPDRASLDGRATTTFVPTAVIVVEILSPNDATWQKLDFYAAQGIEELIVVDPIAREVRCLASSGSTMTEVPASARLGSSADELAAALDWPPLG